MRSEAYREDQSVVVTTLAPQRRPAHAVENSFVVGWVPIALPSGPLLNRAGLVALAIAECSAPVRAGPNDPGHAAYLAEV